MARGAWQRAGCAVHRRWAPGAAVVALVVVALVAGVGGGEAATSVPEVRGELVHEAVGAVRQAGLRVSGVSYRPGGQGEAGTVMETIPGGGQEIEPGGGVHLVVGAVLVPEGPAAGGPEEGHDEDDDDRGKGKGKDKGKGRGRGGD